MAGSKRTKKPTKTPSTKNKRTKRNSFLSFGTNNSRQLTAPQQSKSTARTLIWGLVVALIFLCSALYSTLIPKPPAAEGQASMVASVGSFDAVPLSVSTKFTPVSEPILSPVPTDTPTITPTATETDTPTITPTFTTNEARTATSAMRSSNLTGTVAAIFAARTATYGAVYATGTWRAENYTPPPRTRVPVPTGGGFTKAPTMPPPPSGGGSCPGFDYTCPRLTCAQAYACLAAGNTKLDADHDGKPCEAQCGG